jgi:hypothetical protein
VSRVTYFVKFVAFLFSGSRRSHREVIKAQQLIFNA